MFGACVLPVFGQFGCSVETLLLWGLGEPHSLGDGLACLPPGCKACLATPARAALPGTRGRCSPPHSDYALPCCRSPTLGQAVTRSIVVGYHSLKQVYSNSSPLVEFINFKD